MKIAHLNARSIFTGFNEFSYIVQSSDFDVVMVTETWLSASDDSGLIFIPGYTIFRRDRLLRGGGVAAYVKSHLGGEEVLLDFIDYSTLECLFLKVKLFSRTVILAVFYRPPNTNINSYIQDYDNILTNLTPSCDVFVCLGDFNVNFLSLNNPISNCFESYGLTQLLNEPTRVTDRTSTLIDPIFINDINFVASFGTMPAEDISDHKFVYLVLNVKTIKPPPKIITFRNFRNFNLDHFRQDLQSISWHHLYNEQIVDNKIIIFNNIITTLFNKHIPKRTVRITKPSAPWLTNEIKHFKNIRRKALQKYKRTQSVADRDYYKAIRNRVVSMIRAAKKAYVESLCNQNNPRKTWAALRDLNVRSCKSNVLPANRSNPDNINNYFADFLQNTNDKCKNQILFCNTNSFSTNFKFSFSLATIEDIRNGLFNIKTNAYGTDGISAHMLKLCMPTIETVILHIINCCIEKSYFPAAWKTAIGLPLPKIKNPNKISDLRIISILPAISKILERILHSQMFEYFNSNGLIPNNQCGFRKNYSTATALTTVLDDIICSSDQGLSSVLVLLDFSKAFDTLNHELLCAKLKYYGFNENSASLIKSFLSDRFQKVLCNNNESKTIRILSGVPQGSVLSPLLFIMYTAQILTSLAHSKIQAYADDTQLFFFI